MRLVGHFVIQSAHEHGLLGLTPIADRSTRADVEACVQLDRCVFGGAHGIPERVLDSVRHALELLKRLLPEKQSDIPVRLTMCTGNARRVRELLYAVIDIGRWPSLEVDPETWLALKDTDLAARSDLFTFPERFTLLRVEHSRDISSFARASTPEAGRALYSNLRHVSVLGRPKTISDASGKFSQVELSENTMCSLAHLVRSVPHVTSWSFGDGVHLSSCGDAVGFVEAAAGAKTEEITFTLGDKTPQPDDVEGEAGRLINVVECVLIRPVLRLRIAKVHRAVVEALVRRVCSPLSLTPMSFGSTAERIDLAIFSPLRNGSAVVSVDGTRHAVVTVPGKNRLVAVKKMDPNSSLSGAAAALKRGR